ncbi:FRG domain-containing protein [bacterium]|nr:FRG domain-containing protein [bacterium]
MIETEQPILTGPAKDVKNDSASFDKQSKNASDLLNNSSFEAINNSEKTDEKTNREINSIESFYSWFKEKVELLDKINEVMPFGNKFKLFFRGEDDNTYKLEPSIYRNGRIINEHKFYYEAINRCPEAFTDCKTTFEKLAKMQHYRVPTRLLDVTENPLIALYFAAKSSINKHNGKLYCFFISERAIRFPDDSNTALLANVATIDSTAYYENNFHNNMSNFSKKYEEYALEPDTANRRKILNEATQISKTNPITKELLLKSRRDSGYYASEFSLVDMAQIICVKPKNNNWRISNQSSAFLLFGYLLDKNYMLPLSDLKGYEECFRLLFLKPQDRDRTAIENSIIYKLPLEQDVLDEIRKIENDFRLISFGSSKRSNLSKQITIKQSKIISSLQTDIQMITSNTHSGMQTSKHYFAIKKALSDFYVLDIFKRFIWRDESFLFFDFIEVEEGKKNNILMDLARLGISDSFIYPELENTSSVLCQELDHLQPLVLEQKGNKQVIKHLSKFAEKHSELKVGDIVLGIKSIEDFWKQFSNCEAVTLTVLRRKEKSTKSIDESVLQELYNGDDSEYDKEIFDKKGITVVFPQLSSYDNPLIANYADIDLS